MPHVRSSRFVRLLAACTAGVAAVAVLPMASAQASYSVTLCGQSTYPSARVTIQGGTASVNHTVYYQNCETFTGDLVSSYGFSDAQITVSGSTFYPGNQYTTYTKTKTAYF
ncbi:hypothetical protein OG271_01440 [Micromonospora rifamycinica]|uniref:hypothetical protein n=1 Tax=Micromonospora rifamycinica TaxID=291594 RepID=UPI002E282A1F|nr:hypothetical protein [Micromonospora rifamycinica]